MSRAYYYTNRLSWREVKNLIAYGVKDPSNLPKKLALVRLYK